MSTAIAEFNFGRLRYDWIDKRVQSFVGGLERVNCLVERSPGFIWRMLDDEMKAAQLGPPLSDRKYAILRNMGASATCFDFRWFDET